MSVSESLEELRQRWAEEARQRGEEAAAIDLEDLDLDGDGEDVEELDRDAVIDALRAEPEEPIGSHWRRSA